ncbi:DUF6634 family protein [Paracoccus sp. (in: a-proteobacteria)]|uniref:DUF6634 family protein n=1 Tax=Paracoccus sp. TaxID=267 RepID=UPI00289A3E80|nr:DUF6634 family protein [Paracoccus sp. (in: a-proteobacteria)]
MTPDQSRQLNRALDAIRAAEREPTAAELSASPRMTFWRQMLDHRNMPVLWGEVTDHPKLGTTSMTSSRLIALDRAAGWARTISRWYRLGKIFEAVEGQPARELGTPAARLAISSFELPGFQSIDDPEKLDLLLSAYITLIRKIEAELKCAQPSHRAI